MELLKEPVIIVVAGMEGALPSIVAGMVGIPVIGVLQVLLWASLAVNRFACNAQLLLYYLGF